MAQVPVRLFDAKSISLPLLLPLVIACSKPAGSEISINLVVDGRAALDVRSSKAGDGYSTGVAPLERDIEAACSFAGFLMENVQIRSATAPDAVMTRSSLAEEVSTTDRSKAWDPALQFQAETETTRITIQPIGWEGHLITCASDCAVSRDERASQPQYLLDLRSRLQKDYGMKQDATWKKTIKEFQGDRQWISETEVAVTGNTLSCKSTVHANAR